MFVFCLFAFGLFIGLFAVSRVFALRGEVEETVKEKKAPHLSFLYTIIYNICLYMFTPILPNGILKSRPIFLKKRVERNIIQSVLLSYWVKSTSEVRHIPRGPCLSHFWTTYFTGVYHIQLSPLLGKHDVPESYLFGSVVTYIGPHFSGSNFNK